MTVEHHRVETFAARGEGVVDGVTIRPAGEPPRAAVLSVGTELLLGDLTDTNATWISRRLKEQGVEVVHHLAVRDALDELVAALHWLAGKVHLVVIGGGLGPTADDLTREAVAAAAGVELEARDDLATIIAGRFAAMNRAMAPQNLRQARVPVGATAFPPAGTAPAFALTLTRPSPTRVVALPGVPWELQQLWDDHVVAEVAAVAGHRVTITRVLHVVGRGEADVASVVEPVLERRVGVVLAFLATGPEVQVRLTVSGGDRAAAVSASQPVVDEVSAALGPAVVGVDDEDLEHVVLQRLLDAGQTVSTAESVTGGGVAARLARVAGASQVLMGGATVYTLGTKVGLLGVDADLVRANGEVSAATTVALAQGARRTMGTDWAIGVTGVAGPGSVDGLPVGTCFWALAHPDGDVEVHDRVVPGDRRQVIARVGTAALDLLRRRLAAT